MITQYLGGALLLSASVGISISLVAESKRGVKNLEAVTRLVGYIRRNIDSFLTPIGGILSGYSCEVLDECGFGELMRTRGLSAAARDGCLKLPGEAAEHLVNFAEAVGTGYRDEEVKRCEYYVGIFTDLTEKERENSRKNRDLYRYIPPLGALSLLVVLM